MTSDVPVFDSVSSAVCEFDAVAFAVIEFDDETSGVIELEGVEPGENVLDGVTTSLVGESEAVLWADTDCVCEIGAVNERDFVSAAVGNAETDGGLVADAEAVHRGVEVMLLEPGGGKTAVTNLVGVSAADKYLVREDENDGDIVLDRVVVCMLVGVCDGENGLKEFETEGGAVTETDGGAVTVREDDPVYVFVRVRVRVIV